MHMLDAGIMSDSDSGAPLNCRWVKQVQVPISWIIAFLRGTHGDLVRHLTLDGYLRRGRHIVITTDPSPFGIGAVLEIDGNIVSWLSDTYSQCDIYTFQLKDEFSSHDQQLLEAFCVLVALREWSHL